MQHDWCPYERGRLDTNTHTRRRPREDRGRDRLRRVQAEGGRPHQKLGESLGESLGQTLPRILTRNQPCRHLALGLRPPGLGEDTLLLCGTLLQPPWELTHTPGCWLGLTQRGRAGDKRPEFGARQPLPLWRPPPNPRPPSAEGLNGGCEAELATLSCKAPGVSPVPGARCAPQQESGRTTCRWMGLPACQHNFIYKTRHHPGLWFATPGLEAPSVQVTC